MWLLTHRQDTIRLARRAFPALQDVYDERVLFYLPCGPGPGDRARVPEDAWVEDMVNKMKSLCSFLTSNVSRSRRYPNSVGQQESVARILYVSSRGNQSAHC